MAKFSLVAVAALALFAAPKAEAFPEMVRHHYVNCNSCHVNPNGGGLLTEYGRGMAGEVLSTWSYEDESLFLHGLVKPEKVPGFLNVGGDVRAIQVHQESAALRAGRYILMQASLEAAVTAGPLTAVAAYGEPDRLNHIHGAFTRVYLLGNLTDTIQVKAGRFLPAFGINDPHHILSTRQSLGFGFASERNMVEGHYNGEQWHIAAGLSRSREESALRQKETAGSLQAEKFFSDSYRVGASLWVGESEAQKRRLASLHGILGFSEHWYLLIETAWQHRQALTSKRPPFETGIFHNARLGYELVKGLHLFALEDVSKSVVTDPSSLIVQVGPGVIWYPRPHFEFELAFTKKKILKDSREFNDYAYLMLHYYL